MKKGFKFVEKIAFELDERKRCITLCPHEQKTFIEGEPIQIRVASRGCAACPYFSSMTNKAVKCQYKWRSKFLKKVSEK